MLLIILFAGIVPFIVIKLGQQTPIFTATPIAHKITDFTGLCHIDFEPNDTKDWNQLHQLGIQWARFDLNWDSIQSSATEWNWEEFDRKLAAMKANGIKVDGLLLYDNNNIEQVKGKGNHYIHPDDLPYFLEYVNRTVRRYINLVDAWEIWNEPNIPTFWGGSEADFLELMHQTTELLHSIEVELNIDLIIIAPSISAGVYGYIPPIQENYFKLGLMNYVDVVNFHVYQYNPESLQRSIMEFQSVGEKYNFSGRYWISEIGNPTDGEYSWQVDPYTLADNVIKTFALCVAYNVETVILYTYKDSETSWYASEGHFGMLYANYTWKPGAYALKLFNELCVGLEYRPEFINKIGGITKEDYILLPFLSTTNSLTIIAWHKPFLPISAGRFRIDSSQIIGPIINHEIYTGVQTEIPIQSIEVNTHPVILTLGVQSSNQPLNISCEDSNSVYIVYTICLGLILTLIGVTYWLIYQKGKNIQ